MNILGSLQLGCIYSLLALGVFIAFRVMNTPDLTADGSFTLGMSVSAVCAVAGHPFLGLFAGLLFGAAAGIVTGLLQTKAGIHPILSGILTMTGLYSINLLVMQGTPNISLLGHGTLFSLIQQSFPPGAKQFVRLGITLVICLASIAVVAWFFKTAVGLRIRATGSNEKMVRASSINADAMRIAAIALANGFIGLSGAFLAQYQGYADINAGTGIVIIGLASVIIGETLFRLRSLSGGLIAAAAGAVIYRLLIALVLWLNFFPAYMLRFLSAVIVTIALAAPQIRRLFRTRDKGVQHA
ncbi:ABC transporter permease [Treponema primitia]|uniref:ABC transporter permease n=1 Tax=Treponema primitia TaxID=88058 RepID=UPI00397F3F06